MTTKIAHISRATSTTLPPVVSGFVIADDIVSSCTAVKKNRVAVTVDIAALHAAFEDPYQHRANAENQQRQPERNEQAGGKPTMAFLPGEQSGQFLADRQAQAFLLAGSPASG